MQHLTLTLNPQVLPGLRFRYFWLKPVCLKVGSSLTYLLIGGYDVRSLGKPSGVVCYLVVLANMVATRALVQMMEYTGKFSVLS